MQYNGSLNLFFILVYSSPSSNNIIILFTYRTNTIDQVIIVFVDNTLSDGVLTQEEYNKALATAKQIEGSE